MDHWWIGDSNNRAKVTQFAITGGYFSQLGKMKDVAHIAWMDPEFQKCSNEYERRCPVDIQGKHELLIVEKGSS